MLLSPLPVLLNACVKVELLRVREDSWTVMAETEYWEKLEEWKEAEERSRKINSLRGNWQ